MKKNSAKIFSSGEHKLVSLAKFGAFVFTKPGLALIRKVVRKKLSGEQNAATRPINYMSWLTGHAAQFPQSKDGPKISILLNAYTADEQLLRRAVRSVIEQPYQNWELIIANTGTEDTISQLAQRDVRIKAVADVADDVMPARLKKATGDYMLWMLPDDVLTPWCLAVIAAYINTHRGAAVIYADEDNIDSNDLVRDPYFKPGWSPDTLMSRNYIGHNLIAKRSLLNDDIDVYNGYYDLVLTLTARANTVAHIPLVLFHCTVKPFAETTAPLAINALKTAVQRQAATAIITPTQEAPGCYDIAWTVAHKEKVSVIIPTKDNTELLQKTIDSIFQKTDYPDFEVIVLNNNSTSSAFFKLMEEYKATHPGKFRCADASFPFNFARLMNMGAKLSTGTYLLMCNNDIEVLHDDWMKQMVAQAQQKHNGAVGVKLLFPNDTIQHAGIAMGGNEASEHLFAHRSKDDDGYFFSLKANTNYAAVTAACLMCRKTVFEQVGGMDEQLAVEYNDIDLCLKFLKAGYYNVLLPSVVLYHYESATRGHPFRSRASWLQHEKELKLFTDRWAQIIANDPHYRMEERLNFRF